MTNRRHACCALLLAAVAGGCSLRKTGGGDPPPSTSVTGAPQQFSEDALNATTDVVGYAKYCKQELALPPDVLAPWACLNGTELPTTIDGQPLSAATYPQLSAQQIGCDHPSWLGDPCANYAFVQKRQLSPDVTAYFLCRMRSFSSYKDRAGRLADANTSLTPDTFNALYAFDSLGLIWTSAKTGKTCYFDIVGKVYGGYVASPDDERTATLADLPDPKPPAEMQTSDVAPQIWQKNGRGVWRSPAQVAAVDDCVRCHDSGPLKGSPWINPVFPIAPSDQTLPLQVVGSAFAQWRQRLPTLAISTQPVTDASGNTAASCTSCHRIGGQETCATEIDFATGQTQPGKLSTLGASFLGRTWMPPPPAAWQGKSDADLTSLWSASNAASVKRLKCCCAAPNSLGCYSQDLTVSPLPAPVAGAGPASCL